MASATLTKRLLQMALNNGSTSTGQVRTVNVSLGNVTTTDGYTDDKAVAIAMALMPCLDKTVYRINRIDTNSLSRA